MRFARLLAASSLVAAIVGAGVVAHGSAGRLDGGAAADQAAERGVQALLDGSCDLTTAEAIGARHPEVHQLVVLATSSFDATYGTAFVAAQTAGGSWACQTEPVSARFGREGTRVLVDRRSGDGTT
ncbi:MAG: hypothetical protein ACR2O6_11230, partial [Ilumatobacteraceae bacterium]